MATQSVSAPIVRSAEGVVDVAASVAELRHAYVDAGFFRENDPALDQAMVAHRQSLLIYALDGPMKSDGSGNDAGDASAAGAVGTCRVSWHTNWGRSSIAVVIRLFVNFHAEAIFSCSGSPANVCSITSVVAGLPLLSAGGGVGRLGSGCVAGTLVPQNGSRPSPAVLTFSAISADRSIGFKPAFTTIT